MSALLSFPARQDASLRIALRFLSPWATHFKLPMIAIVLLANALTTASAAENVSTPVMVTTGNQSAFIQADGSFRVRNVPMFATWGVRPEGGLFPGPTVKHRVRAVGSMGELAASGRFELNLVINGPRGTVSGIQLSPLLAGIQDPIKLRMEINTSQLAISPPVIGYVRVYAIFTDGGEQEVTGLSSLGSTSRYLLFERSSASVRGASNFPGGNHKATVFAQFDGLLASVPVNLEQYWPTAEDTDGDGMPNIWEISYGLNPNDASDANQDVDNDGLRNLSEYLAGTNPRQPDTDFDGLLDGSDDNPLVPESVSPLLIVHQPQGGAPIDLKQTVVTVTVSASDNAMVRSVTTALGSQVQVIPVNAASVDALTIQIPISSLGLTTPQILPLQVVATDYAGNFTIVRRNLHFQATPPTITFVAPGAGMTYIPGNEIAIHIQASDEHGVSGVELRADNDIIATSSGGELHAAYMVPSERTTPLHFDAIAVDLLGNVATVRRTLQPDVAPDDEGPQLDISHASGATVLVGSEVVITVFANDPAGVASVDLHVSHGELTRVAGSLPQWIFRAPGEPTAIAVTLFAVDTLGNSAQQQISWNVVVADDVFTLVSPGPEESLYELTRTVLVFDVPGYLTWGDIPIQVNGRRVYGNFSDLDAEGRRTYTCDILPDRGTKFLRIMAAHNRNGDEPRLVHFTRRVLPWKPVQLHGTIASPLGSLESAAVSVGEQTAPVAADGSFFFDLDVPSPTGRFDVTAALLLPGEYLHAGSLTYVTSPADCDRGEATLPEVIALTRIPDAYIGQTAHTALVTSGSDSEGNPHTRVHATPGLSIAFSTDAEFVTDPVSATSDVIEVVRRLKAEIDIDYLAPFRLSPGDGTPRAITLNGREEAQLTWLSEGSASQENNPVALQAFINADRSIQVFHRGSTYWPDDETSGFMRWYGKSDGGEWSGIVTDGYHIAAKDHWDNHSEDGETGEIIYREVGYENVKIEVVGEGVEHEEHDDTTIYEVDPDQYFSVSQSFALLDSPGQLLGRILRDGEPVSNAEIRTVGTEPTVRTNANGYFKMDYFDNVPLPWNQSAIVYHVSQSVLESGDGRSWETAFRTIEEALAKARANDDIWVAAGVYLPTDLVDPSDPRSATFRITDWVRLYGGFEGVERKRSAADPKKWKSVLSGDFGVAGDGSDNSYRVVTALGYLIMDGFTITGGNGRSGAGVYLPQGGSLTNCIIAGNDAGEEAGGGVYSDSNRYTGLLRCVFVDNNAASGSAVFSPRNNSMYINTCVFVGTGGRQDGNIIDIKLMDAQTYIMSFNDCTFLLTWPARVRIQASMARPQFRGCVWSVLTAPIDSLVVGDAQFSHCIVPVAISPDADGGANRVAQPIFRDANNPAGPDHTWGTEDDGLFLTPESPGADHVRVGIGWLETDLLGNLRTGGAAPDAGAYEFAPLRVEDGYVVPTYGNAIQGKTVEVELEITGPDGAQVIMPVVIFPNQMNVLRPVELPVPLGISMRWPNVQSHALEGDQ